MLPWLTEPGLLTARVRAACGAAMELTLLRVAPAALTAALAARLGVDDRVCLNREIEFTCAGTRWIYARSVFPDSTVRAHPWLAELGGNGLGEALSKVADVQREPLEYLDLPQGHELALAACADPHVGRPLWARRKLYRLGGWPILVQEVYLPALYRT